MTPDIWCQLWELSICRCVYIYQLTERLSVVLCTAVLAETQFRLNTYLLTPWCRVLLEKLTGLQLVKKFPVFDGTRGFITALTSARHLSLSWASPILSIYPHPTSCRSVIILSTHLRLGLPSGLFPSGFPTKNLYTPCICDYNTHVEADNRVAGYEGME